MIYYRMSINRSPFKAPPFHFLAPPPSVGEVQNTRAPLKNTLKNVFYIRADTDMQIYIYIYNRIWSLLW